MNRYERMTKMVENMECTECRGHGNVTTTMFHPDRLVAIECPECGGDGTINDGSFIMHCDKDDLIAMILGSDVPSEKYNHPLVSRAGRYMGGHIDRWVWNPTELYQMTPDLLVTLRSLCRTK